MTKQILVALAAALSFSHAMAMTCDAGTQKAVVKTDTVGAISIGSFKAIDFASPQSIKGALTDHTAQRIAGGTLVCAVLGDGFFDYATHLKVPGRNVDLWIDAKQELLAPAD